MSNSWFSLAHKANGEVWSWGYNQNGQLGINVAADSKISPVLVVGNHSFSGIYAGDAHSTVVKANGEGWTWGYNNWKGNGGCLGDNSLDTKSSPVMVVGSHSFAAACGGGYMFSAFRKANGEVWSCGMNNSGQLGDGSITNCSSPVLVVGNHSFAEAYCGENHGIACKTDGTSWVWGYNYYGNLGDNTTTGKSSPVAVVGSHSFSGVTASYSVSAGRKANGELWTWGNNDFGQLGTGNWTLYSSPVLVIGNHNFVESKGYGGSSYARKIDGMIWSWGFNDSGQLGDNTGVSKSSPILIVGNHSFIEIGSGGSGHAYALKVNGEVWSWGNNANGELGDNTGINRSSPVLVVGNHSFDTLSFLEDQGPTGLTQFALPMFRP